MHVHVCVHAIVHVHVPVYFLTKSASVFCVVYGGCFCHYRDVSSYLPVIIFPREVCNLSLLVELINQLLFLQSYAPNEGSYKYR